MKLPTLPFLKKQQPSEYYLALLLEEKMLRAVVFEESNGIMNTIGEGKQPLPVPLDDTSFEELLDAADKAISKAESTLPEGVQSHKTIFGVKQDWTENLQISKDHLSTLKKLCDELDLQPIGFLVFAEAIAHLLQKEEGAPVSGILVEIGTKHIIATLLRAGRVAATQQIPIEDDIPKAVDKLLAQFTEVEILPSRIILLDIEKRPRLAQQLSNHSWSKQLPFLHVPQVTPLKEGFETLAVLFGTASQMGFAMSDMPSTRLKQAPKPMIEIQEKESAEPREEAEEEKLPQPEGTPEEVAEEEKTEQESEEPSPEMEDEDEIPEKSLKGDNFGFVKDQDVLESVPQNPKAFHPKNIPEDETEDEFADETFADIPEEVKEDEERSKLPGLGSSAVMLTSGMQKVLGNIKKLPLSSLLGSIKTIIPGRGNGLNLKLLAIPVFIILLILGGIWYFFGVKATATLLINPKNVEASQSVTFSSTDNTNLDSSIIGGTVVPIQEDGKVSTDATGKKDIGDKAKGTVTIYNNDDSSHTISAGSTITSANGLKFVTAKDVTVASASGDIFSGTKPGTQSVDVTAANIGTEYNLPSGTKFAVGSSTVIAAKNDNAFSGGTKKSVTVVAQADLDKLTQDLTQSLSDKANQDMQKNGGGKELLPVFLSTDISNKQFDQKIGDEASSVNLSATISFQALSYTKTDLTALGQKILEKNNNNDNVASNNLTTDIQDTTVSKDGKSVAAKLSVKAGLLPKVDTSQVAKRLAGKSFDQAAEILSDIPQLASVKATLSPNLFFLPHIFPRMASHIMVGVAANE